MAKILLVKPRYLGPEFQSITHPMGLMYIGATLIRAGHSVRLHDCAASPSDNSDLAGLLSTWRPDFVGLSVIVSELESTKRLMTVIRSVMPDVPVIFGGPWPSANPGEAITTFGADFVILGEGELSMPALVDAIGRDESRGWMVSNLRGVSMVVDGSVAGTPGDPLTEQQLDELPFPAWELLDHNLYARMPSMAGVGCRPYMTVITSRGCPFRCAYCHQTLGKKFRKRSPASVLAEFEELNSRLGFSEFEIVDDCFNLDRERMTTILEGIRDRVPGARLHFPNGVRSDRLEPADVVLMRKAGTVSACFAIETSSPELQKVIRKNLDIDKALTTIRTAVDQGIYSTGFFMLGLPGETIEQARGTVAFAASSPLHRAIFMLTTPFAGTELADMAADILKSRGFEPDPCNLNYFTSSVNISAMTDAELQEVFRSAYRRFYMNPARVVRVILHHPRKWSLPRYGLITIMKILPGTRRIMKSKV